MTTDQILSKNRPWFFSGNLFMAAILLIFYISLSGCVTSKQTKTVYTEHPAYWPCDKPVTALGNPNPIVIDDQVYLGRYKNY